ncbi:hypothetical protein N7466_003189 [Penicillium verhagenii]|uniref:uncharacterized protein n=1 Tax=Penicillium verhagenii TaxID=1562060 RepID=UPI002545A59A|nr:uncharacterized protein N7466_003189 [Penicillium verhagenii]KAJ5936739.1 hypothetical protein N7466_003189 [Penicillium verhagenii]
MGSKRATPCVPLLSGPDCQPPREWASIIGEAGQSAIRRHSQGKTEGISKILLLAAEREPSLRPELKWSGEKFAQEIKKNMENLEAAAIYVVGIKVENACGHCQQGYGPFQHCVFAKGYADACANCHWKGNGFICDFSDRRIFAKEYRRRAWVASTIARTEMTLAIEEMREEYENSQKLIRAKLLELQDRITGTRRQARLMPLSRMDLLDAFDGLLKVHEDTERKGKEVIERMTDFDHGAGKSVRARMLHAFLL